MYVTIITIPQNMEQNTINIPTEKKYCNEKVYILKYTEKINF